LAETPSSGEGPDSTTYPDFTAENAEIAERIPCKNLCGLCGLCGKPFAFHSFGCLYRNFSISGSGFTSRQLLRQGVGYGNPAYKAVIAWTF
jgi:hypothetical protein